MRSPLEQSVFSRTERLLGADALERLAEKRVILFGTGGVGSWCAEGLVRNGLRHLTLVDSDEVCLSNINRQLMATTRTIGEAKVEALKRRLLEINPEADITALKEVFNEETADSFRLDSYDCIIDAIDSLKDKATLILKATATRAAFFSSMGAACKVDPTGVRVAEFWEVRGCPLGAALRKKLRKEGTLPKKKFLCVYDEEVLENKGPARDEPGHGKAVVNGSLVHITAIFGFTLCGLALKDLIQV